MRQKKWFILFLLLLSTIAVTVSCGVGNVGGGNKTNTYYVWPVSAGQ